MSSLAHRRIEFTRRSRVRTSGGFLRRLWASPIGWEALALYTVLALVFGRHTIAHLGSVCTCGEMPDSWEIAWPFAWFPHALLHGLNPWYTHAMWAPPGFNVAGVTSFPLVATLMSPVTWLWGPITSANVVNLGATIVTGYATYLLCRYISKDRLAALIAGATLGFGTYVLMQMWAGHIVITLFFAPQLATLAVLRYLDGAIGRRRVIAELTACLIAQLFTDAEIFATMALYGGLLLLLGYAFATTELRAAIRSLIVPLVIACAITLVLSADYLFWLLRAPKYAVGIGQIWTTDLLSYVIPGSWTWVGGQTFSSVFTLFNQGAESDAYLGLPLILIAMRWISTHWQLRTSKFLTTAAVISILWTLGPTLHIGGQSTIWLPYRVLERLPIFNEILESRTAVYTELICAVILSLWLADRRRKAPWLKWVVALVAAIFLLPNLVNINYAYDSNRAVPKFFATNMYRSYISHGATVLPINWAESSPSLMWQAQDGMYFNLASGYFTTTRPPGWTGNPTLVDLWYDTPQAGDGQELRRILIKRHVDDVIVVPAEMPKWSKTLREAGLRHPLHVGGIYLYRGQW